MNYLLNVTWWIRQKITRALADKGDLIRKPVRIHIAIAQMRKAQRELTQAWQRKPTIEELASYLDIDVERVESLIEWSNKPLSLDAPVDEDEEGTEFADFIQDQKGVNPEQFVEEADSEEFLKRTLTEVVNKLPDRERDIIELRFGLNGKEEHSLEEIGIYFGVTRERIQQLEKSALSMARNALEKKKIKMEDLF